jgi:hypothetical protein
MGVLYLDAGFWKCGRSSLKPAGKVASRLRPFPFFLHSWQDKGIQFREQLGGCLFDQLPARNCKFSHRSRYSIRVDEGLIIVGPAQCVRFHEFVFAP